MDKVKEAVDKFNKENGNIKFTVKELIIYFNDERKEDINELKTVVANLPCEEHMSMYLSELITIKTTIRNVKKALVVGMPAIIGIIGLVKVL